MRWRTLTTQPFVYARVIEKGAIVMSTVLATGIFGAIGIALAIEVLSVATAFSNMQHLAACAGCL